MTEREIEQGCRKGDNKARKELYEMFGGIMLGLIMRYVTDNEEAKDLLQDGFIQAFDKFGKFTWRGEGSLRAWLSRLFINESLLYLRKNKTMNDYITIEQETEEIPDEEEVSQISETVLMGMIAKLPAGYRTVFNMYVIDGYSHKEIGKALKISESTSASQFLRAKRLLAKEINNYLKK
ncbi:MAG: sigma-70 family RNA polymerase sigma factor [Muribaculaceae bacterium]|jgi:RNA polymerase sigma-70 factor, ECF subfamily|nr:sigma-70 family RNA polymerase sigma factor [Muribaculaceae bacterium]